MVSARVGNAGYFFEKTFKKPLTIVHNCAILKWGAFVYKTRPLPSIPNLVPRLWEVLNCDYIIARRRDKVKGF